MPTEGKSYYEQQVERIAEKRPLYEHQFIQVRQSRAFMEKHLATKIDLDEIAAAAFMSRFHFIRVFKQAYGITPRQYLRDLRVSKAKELLKKGSSVTQVCFDVGYSSLPTFSSAFKRSTGYAPLAYQKMHKSNLK